MTKVNNGTKKAQELIHDMFSTYYKGKTLYDVYGKCSAKKRNSWEAIKRDCEILGGENLHITGAGSYSYSCIYAYPIISEETGEITDMVIRKETAGNTYELTMPIDEYERRK